MALARAQSNYATPYAFSTLAGANVSGSADGTGSAARFDTPQGVAIGVDGINIYAEGTAYVADTNNHTIRKITPYGSRLGVPPGIVTTLAGLPGVSGPASANGTGSAARFNLPRGVAVDNAGDVYVADTSNHAIRKITPAGLVSTLAGGIAGSNDGTGAGARFFSPNGVAVDTAGNVYVADTANHSIRKITPVGVVTTLAGALTPTGFGSTDGTGAAARFSSPRGVAVDGNGNAYVADRDNNSIRKISPSGVVTTLAGNLSFNPGSTDGTGSAARFNQPYAVAVDGGGNVYVAEGGNHTIRKITAAGVVTTLAGVPLIVGNATDDVAGNAARFRGPQGIAVDGEGNLHVADTNNHTIRIGGLPPVFAVHPISQSVAPGGTVRFMATTVSAFPPAPGFGWESTAIDRPVPSLISTISNDSSGFQTLTNEIFMTDVQASKLGNYNAIARNRFGSTRSNVAVLSFLALDVGRLINLSILTSLAAGGDAFTMGYVVGGSGTAGAKPLVIRVAGPSLTQLGVTGVLDDPQLELFAGSTKTGENDNWGGGSALTSAMAGVGAFAFSGATSRDAAASVNITSGDNSVKVSAVGSGSGAVIAELYDATPATSFSASTPRLINVSVLKDLGTGLTAGFVIGGTTAKTVLIRAVGPTIGAAPFNVPGAVADPQLTLFSGSTSIGTNDNWGGTAPLSAAFAQVGAFALPATSRDAALLATLLPGNYTVQVSGVGGTSGVAIVEVYDVP